jgi:hypothetical protein
MTFAATMSEKVQRECQTPAHWRAEANEAAFVSCANTVKSCPGIVPIAGD